MGTLDIEATVNWSPSMVTVSPTWTFDPSSVGRKHMAFPLTQVAGAVTFVLTVPNVPQASRPMRKAMQAASTTHTLGLVTRTYLSRSSGLLSFSVAFLLNMLDSISAMRVLAILSWVLP